MKRLLILGMLVCAMAASSDGGEAPGELAVQRAEKSAGNPLASDASFDKWEWYFDVPPAEKTESLWDGFLLKPEVFAAANPNLSDLRLADAKGREIPCALRVLREKQEEKGLPASQYNVRELPDGSAEAFFDLGNNPSENQQIELNISGSDFRRRVQVDGSDQKDGGWGTLADEWVASFHVQSRDIDIRRVQYAPSRFRYLRVQVSPDRSKQDDKPKIESVRVLHPIQIPGELLTLPAAPGPRKAVRAYDAPASAWMLDLGGEQIPCDRLTLDVKGDDFQRRAIVELPDANGYFRQVADVQLRRRHGDPKTLEIRFSKEVAASQLRLVVLDYQNKPLDLQGVTFAAPAREIVYTCNPELAGPLRLYAGNPKAEPTHYEFQASLPEKLVPPPMRTEIGEKHANPDYRPDPKPLTERYPWLPYVVLGTASLILLCLLALLGNAVKDFFSGKAG